jgi:hypothetical protein
MIHRRIDLGPLAPKHLKAAIKTYQKIVDDEKTRASDKVRAQREIDRLRMASGPAGCAKRQGGVAKLDLAALLKCQQELMFGGLQYRQHEQQSAPLPGPAEMPPIGPLPDLDEFDAPPAPAAAKPRNGDQPKSAWTPAPRLNVG